MCSCVSVLMRSLHRRRITRSMWESQNQGRSSVGIFFCSRNYCCHLLLSANISRINPNLIRTVFYCRNRHLIIKMNICHKRDRYESGTIISGNIKSAIGLGLILNRKIGDTIRVSLTGDPVTPWYFSTSSFSNEPLLTPTHPEPENRRYYPCFPNWRSHRRN